MTKIFVIPGHGGSPYDPGACGNGHQEAERVRALAQRIKDFGGDSVILADFSRNYYADNGISRLTLPTDTQIIELHMDAASAAARGGHVVINGNYAADAYDKALANAVSAIFPGRSETLVPRTDLANPNRAAAKGYSYRLVEFGFITNREDVNIFNSRIDEVAKAVLGAFGIGAGSAPVPTPKPPTPKPPVSNKKNLGKVNVYYKAKVGGQWLPEVKNFNNNNDDGYAGIPCKGFQAFAVKVDKGAVKYRAHIKGGSWLPYVTGYNVNDFNNGYAGDGREIDGVEVYYITPEGYEYQQAWYRSQTADRAGWLGVCCDDGNSVAGYDGWAGMYGESMDRLQICISDRNPF